MSVFERARAHTFKVNDRVQLSKLGRARCPTMPVRGTVIGLSRRFTALHVLMDGRKTPVMLHISYLSRAGREGRRADDHEGKPKVEPPR